MNWRITLWGFVLLSVLALISGGCSNQAKPVRQQAAVMDNPDHHELRGRDFIERNNWLEARRSFRLALELAPRHSRALAGMSLVEANEATKAGKSDQERDQLLKKSQSLLEQALDEAKTPKDEAYANSTAIRVYTLSKTPEAWLEEAEKHFRKARSIMEDNSDLYSLRAEPHFYMARAYQAANDYGKASEHYQTVLELNLGFTTQASYELENLQKVARAEPGSRAGKRIARLKAITRADMAALLVEELHIRELYGRTQSQQQDNSFQSPNKQFQTSTVQAAPKATDIASHPLRADIQEILDLEVRGLEASPQHLYYPAQTITRAEFALMLEDILIKVTGEQGLSTKFIGETSPWSDVRSDSFYYNAARTLVSRNIMSVPNRTRGEFRPGAEVSGADALLAIRTLKDELQTYVRSPQS